MPDTMVEIWAWVAEFAGPETRAVVEQVQGYTGLSPTTGSGMFRFGESSGCLKMALTAAGIKHEVCQPQRWQRELGVQPRKKDESKTAWKNRLKAKAVSYYPHLKGITLKTCDALLMAEYCRRKHEGLL
jgi:hypothetical protein